MLRKHDHEHRETDTRQLLSCDAYIGVPRRCLIDFCKTAFDAVELVGDKGTKEIATL